ncbi:MAG: restriction endonuclease subunit S [Oscillospiraceae bacterium]|nr:restriction endonuclease subunit S [Oscillospiraceae bacterium]
MARLGDISTLITKGTTPTSLGFGFTESGINFVKIESISDNGDFLKDKFAHINYECNEKLKRSQLQENDILFSIAGAIGRTAIVTNDILPANTNQALAIIRIPQGVINYKYLLYALNSDGIINQANKQKQGVAQLNLSLQNIADLDIPIPSEQVQNKIVETIGQLDNIIHKRKQQLSKLDELVKSRFIELFGDPETNPYEWEKVTVEEVCSSIVRGPFGSALKKEFFVEPSETTYKVYEQKHAIQKSAAIGTYYVTAKKFAELRRFECVAGDILMSCSGTMGELYQLPEGCEKGLINQALCKFTLNERILPIVFLTYMKQTIGNLETKGSGIQNIAAVSYVKTMPINLAPMEVQEQFATFVEQTDKSKLAIQQSLEQLETLKKSLMQQYFG